MWNPPHIDHRKGIQCDICRYAWNGKNAWDGSEKVWLTIDQWDSLKKIIEDITDKEPEDEKDHYHVIFKEE